MPGTPKVYSSNDVIIIVGNIIVDRGRGESFFSYTLDEEGFTKQIGADGEGTRSQSNNKAARMTLQLMMTSDINDLLSDLHNQDLATGGGLVPILVKDLNGRTLIRTEAAWVVKHPDWEYAKESGEASWELDTTCLEIDLGGSRYGIPLV